MKPWQLNRKIKGLSNRIDNSAKTETRFDINCFSEPERRLFDNVQEIVDKYAPGRPPQDVIEKNADLCTRAWKSSVGGQLTCSLK